MFLQEPVHSQEFGVINNNMAVFRALILGLFFTVFVYITHQLVRFAELPTILSLATVAFLFCLFLIIVAMPLFFWSRRSPEQYQPWHETFFSAAHFSMAYISFLLTFVIVRDIGSFILSYTAPDFAMNSLYGKTMLGLMLVIPLFLIVLGTLIVRLGPKLVKVTIPFENLPAGLDGLRILHVTDLHIAPGLPISFIEKLTAKIQTLNADLVVFTGDILDSYAIRHLTEFEIIKNAQGKHGVFYVPGNHEYYWNIEQSLAAFDSIGFNVLLNQTKDISINGTLLQISGLADPAARQFDNEPPNFDKVTAPLRPDSFKMLLVHQPFLADQACTRGFDLQLSGHTHGGQFFPWNFLIVFFQKYSKGLYKLRDMRLYVNQGTGYWGPSLRLGTFCELTEITLKKA
ncbi:MAG: metallophosphoesterase [Bacillota bacterium]